jgi:hypothetical protein
MHHPQLPDRSVLRLDVDDEAWLRFAHAPHRRVAGRAKRASGLGVIFSAVMPCTPDQTAVAAMN